MAYSRDEKKQFVEARANELKETLAQAVEDLEQSENWKKFLKANARFHNYSFGNVLLIMTQFPEATQVAAYGTWKKMGRQVSKGSKGITIMTPRPFKKRDEAGNVRVDDNGNELKGMSFGTGSVFDISQTDVVDEELWAHHEGSSLVKILDGEADEDLLDSLGYVSKAIGFEFILDELDGMRREVNGYTTLGDSVKEIHVRASNPLAQKIKTSIHELGHALMHATEGEEYSADGKAHRGIAELEAESVAYIVSDALGMDTSAYSVGYIAGWSKGDPEMIRQLGDSVNKASKRIMAELDNVYTGSLSEEASEPVEEMA